MNLSIHSTTFARLAREAGIALFGIVVALGICVWLAGAIHTDVLLITKQRSLSDQLQSRNDILTRFVSEYERVQDTHSKLINAFPPEDNVLDFVGAIDSIAQKHNLTHDIHLSSPSDAMVPGGDGSFPLKQTAFTLTLQSNVFILSEFLKDFENLPYFTHVSNISVTGTSAEGWRGASNVTIQGTLYIRKEKNQ